MASRCPIQADAEFRPPDQACRDLVARIVASREFLRATRQREFLRYVVDRKLAGRPDEVTEALIGHRVYLRRPTYDSGNDSIVRTEAGTLRKRLERYFAGEGRSEPVLLEIPRGGYLPVFRPRAETPSTAQPETHQEPNHGGRPTRRQLIWMGASAALATAAVLGWRRAASARLRDAQPARSVATVELESSDPRLTVAFQQAKLRALSCVYTGDPVGEWYATRPDGGSNVFCMRDVAHQNLGAAVLGLHRHTANMLRRFARSVARNRDWCGYWIITKDGMAGPDAYTSDEDFGYCLPASFDILRACRRQLLWTGDSGYVDGDFLNFYDRTAVDYQAAWDPDRDGIMENLRRPRVRASYYRPASHFITSADLVAAQYAGCLTYAAMQEPLGREGSLSQRLSKEFRAKADALRHRFNTGWWDPATRRFRSGMLADRTFAADLVPECNLYSLLFGIPQDGEKTEAELDALVTDRPHFAGAYSYVPEVLYRYRRNDRAYEVLLEIARPDFFGKDVGEVAFAVLGAAATGLMGLAPDAPRSTLETQPRLSGSLEWVRISRLPVMRNEISVEHRGVRESRLTNTAGPALQWKAAFPVGRSGEPAYIEVDGVRKQASAERRANGQMTIVTVVPVGPGQSRTARLAD